MLNLYELEQLVALADLGTLSRVSEAFHISTPSVTRSMQNLEQEFGVSLFSRSKNRIELNQTGQVAVEQARRVLAEAGQAIRQVRTFDAGRKTIRVESCAPAPLWTLLRRLSERFPGMTISSHIGQNAEVLSALKEEACDLAILPFSISDERFQVTEYMKENLFICVPREHSLAVYREVTFEQINGFNFLLRTELGFWDTLCREKMPASRFLVQTDEFAFAQLVEASSMPCFSTDVGRSYGKVPRGRVDIPILDPEARVTFYMVAKKEGKCGGSVVADR